MMMTDDVTG